MANDTILPDHTLSKAGEDYLEAIYRISLDQPENDRSVRSVDIAESLDVSKASVNKALSLLKEQGMVEQSRYGRVTLTSDGEETARQVWRAHRALERFLNMICTLTRTRPIGKRALWSTRFLWVR